MNRERLESLLFLFVEEMTESVDFNSVVEELRSFDSYSKKNAVNCYNTFL